jgi:hypothetical protein
MHSVKLDERIEQKKPRLTRISAQPRGCRPRSVVQRYCLSNRTSSTGWRETHPILSRTAFPACGEMPIALDVPNLTLSNQV